MASRDAIVRYLDTLLDVGVVRDFGPNGLQVEGAREVRTVALGVSASLALFEEAAARGAQMIVVHHGMLWDRDPRPVTGIMRRRLGALITHDMNLCAYHLPLDRHPVVGNNACLAAWLGLTDVRPFAEYHGVSIGVQGVLAPAVAIDEAVSRIRAATGGEATVFAHGPGSIARVGIVSGAAAENLADAIAEGLDLYLTGEAKEQTLHLVREAGVHFVAAGHYNTERLGVQALGPLLEREFGVETFFLDLPNPV